MRHPTAAWVTGAGRKGTLTSFAQEPACTIEPQVETPSSVEKRSQGEAIKQPSDGGFAGVVAVEPTQEAQSKEVVEAGRQQRKKGNCFSWSNNQGRCGEVQTGKPCTPGRIHVCHKCLSDKHRSSVLPQLDWGRRSLLLAFRERWPPRRRSRTLAKPPLFERHRIVARQCYLDRPPVLPSALWCR